MFSSGKQGNFCAGWCRAAASSTSRLRPPPPPLVWYTCINITGKSGNQASIPFSGRRRLAGLAANVSVCPLNLGIEVGTLALLSHGQLRQAALLETCALKAAVFKRRDGLRHQPARQYQGSDQQAGFKTSISQQCHNSKTSNTSTSNSSEAPSLRKNAV